MSSRGIHTRALPCIPLPPFSCARIPPSIYPSLPPSPDADATPLAYVPARGWCKGQEGVNLDGAEGVECNIEHFGFRKDRESKLTAIPEHF